MTPENRLLVAFITIALVLSITSVGCRSQSSGQSSTSAPANQGFLQPFLKDAFVLLGALLSIEKILRALISSARSGRIRLFYTQHLLPFLISRAYEREDVKAINRYLEDINIDKITSKDENKRKIGIKQLAVMPATKRSFQALAMALNQEKSKHLRAEIVRALSFHVDYGSNDQPDPV